MRIFPLANLWDHLASKFFPNVWETWMILTCKRLLVDIFLICSSSKSLAFCVLISSPVNMTWSRNRGFVNNFSRRATCSHRQDSLLKMNFFIKKEELSRWSKQIGKIVFTAAQFTWCSALNERIPALHTCTCRWAVSFRCFFKMKAYCELWLIYLLKYCVLCFSAC